jgi:hypothetical protein
MHSWPDEFDYSPIPNNPSSEQLLAHITEILNNHHALEESHSEELVRLCRATALKFEAHGHHDEAQEWRNYANSSVRPPRSDPKWQISCAPTSKTPTATTRAKSRLALRLVRVVIGSSCCAGLTTSPCR